MSARAIPALLLAALAAGCLAGDGRPPAGPLFDRSPWTLNDCALLAIAVPVDPERLLKHLPPGFAAQRQTGPLTLVLGDSTILVTAATCAAEHYAGILAGVIPADTVGVHDADHHFVKFDTIVADDARRALLADRGYPARTGSVEITTILDDAPGARVTLDGFGVVVLQGSLADAEPSRDARVAEYMRGGEAIATWTATSSFEGGRSGPGTLEVPAGTWLADVVGGTRVTGTLVAGAWSVREGELQVPLA